MTLYCRNAAICFILIQFSHIWHSSFLHCCRYCYFRFGSYCWCSVSLNTLAAFIWFVISIKPVTKVYWIFLLEQSSFMISDMFYSFLMVCAVTVLCDVIVLCCRLHACILWNVMLHSTTQLLMYAQLCTYTCTPNILFSRTTWLWQLLPTQENCA